MKSVAVLIEDGVFALFFSSPSWGIWQLKCPRPQEFAIKDKKWLCWELAGRKGVGGGGGGDLQLTDAINTLWEMHSRVGELFFVIIIVYVPPNKILILGSSFITGFQKLFATIPRIRFNFFTV